MISAPDVGRSQPVVTCRGQQAYAITVFKVLLHRVGGAGTADREAGVTRDDPRHVLNGQRGRLTRTRRSTRRAAPGCGRRGPGTAPQEPETNLTHSADSGTVFVAGQGGASERATGKSGRTSRFSGS